MNEALVHNGDFANYASVSEYLAQRHIYPLFLTDTEVSVQVFDLLYRTYGYPLEYVIEALAPTTERDFTLLPPEKQRIYEALQVTHMHASPDGPWFFLIAQADEENGKPAHRLTCITDTSMLRPQVFAWQQAGEDGPAIGFAASEKQAIDAALASLAQSDGRFWSRADKYWNARGGSHTDGGAFIFTAVPQANGSAKLTCTDKFGHLVTADTTCAPYKANGQQPVSMTLPDGDAAALIAWARAKLSGWSYADVRGFLAGLVDDSSDAGRTRALAVLTWLMDHRYPTGRLRRSSLLALYDASLAQLAAAMGQEPTPGFVVVDGDGARTASPQGAGKLPPVPVFVIDACHFEPEGPDSAAQAIINLYRQGGRRFVVVHAGGHRFIGNGLGPDTSGVRIDVYGSSGDYLASGIDGLEIVVHGNAQDQLAQIMKAGKLVVYGDVGQTFGYAAKGGQIFVLGNAAGRPFINGVGKPRAVINGTCLDYLAESFMAGDPLHGGGFVVLNGLALTDDGEMVELETPYPGGNLFSLASGGAIYVRDPHGCVTSDQLNGGDFYPFTQADWELIRPYLDENGRLFDITIDQLLTVNGQRQNPETVYRKIGPAAVRALQAEEAWVHK